MPIPELTVRLEHLSRVQALRVQSGMPFSNASGKVNKMQHHTQNCYSWPLNKHTD